MIAEWMIITENGCCLRLLGIIMNEQPAYDYFSVRSNLCINQTIYFHRDSVHSL